MNKKEKQLIVESTSSYQSEKSFNDLKTSIDMDKVMGSKLDKTLIKKAEKKNKLIVGLSIAAAFSVILAIGLPIALSKLFPSVNMSFLKNYQAQIDDAESLGISLENKAPSFVKQKVDDHEIVNVPFVKKGKKTSTNKRSALKNAAEGYFKNADGVLNRYLVYENYTFVEYVARKSEMIQDENGGPEYYYPAYYRTFNPHDWWLFRQLTVRYREDQYINDYSIDENGVADFDKNGGYAWNKTHQSFVIDNRTGYIYPLDFLKVGESISVVNGALSLNTENVEFHVTNRLIEFNIDNDNLVITNVVKNEGLKYAIICKDKHGQYFIAADIMNDQVDKNNNIYAFNKNYGDFYENGPGGYYKDGIIKYNSVEKELFMFENYRLTVFGDEFAKIDNLESYEMTLRNGHSSYTRKEDGTYDHEMLTIDYSGGEEFYYLSLYGRYSEVIRFYSTKCIKDYENDEMIFIMEKQIDDTTTTLAAYKIKIGLFIQEFIKETSDDNYIHHDYHGDDDNYAANSIVEKYGEVFFEGFDSYRVYKDDVFANYCLLEIKISSFNGTEVYVLTNDEDGNYVFVKKESYVPIDITITISPINKD